MAPKKKPGTSAATRAGLAKAGRAAARVYEDGSVSGRMGAKIPSPGTVVGRAAAVAAQGAKNAGRKPKRRARNQGYA